MKATRRFITSVTVVFLLAAAVLGMLLVAHKTLKPKLGLDLEGGLSVVLTAPAGTHSDILDETVNIMRNRIDALGVAEPDISREGNLNILIEVPGVKDPSALIKVVGSTAQLYFRPVTAVLGPSATMTVSPADIPTQTVTLKDQTGNLYLLAPAALQGDAVKSAAAVVDTTGNWSVSVTFKGGKPSSDWTALTSQLACNRDKQTTPNAVAIEIDSVVQSAPTMNSDILCNTGITSGSTQITGNFTETGAKDLALVLNTGALPVKLTQSQVQTVSATLGKQALRAGLIAGALGLALVMLYVAVYYRALGLQTWLGLFVFSLFTYGLVVAAGRGIGFSLSLAGIAGLIVSVGITTDSYIVFFERVKEEIHAGKTLRSSIDRGFKSARGTLFTADSVTFLAALILYLLAVGSVRGFALTLGMATALDVALFLALTYPLAALLGKKPFFAENHLIGMRPILEGSGQKGMLRKIYRSEFAIDFVGRRKLWLSISGVLVGISVLAVIPGIHGLRYGIDFRGGSLFTAPVGKSVTVPGIKDELARAGLVVAQVQIATDPTTHKSQVQVQTNAVSDPAAQTKMEDALSKAVGTTSTAVSVDSVGKTWGAQISQKALRGLIIFLVVVILYMSWRLERKMAMAGIIALLHDMAITAGVYALAGLEVTPATVIGVLTILGYSLYDTVVVFDKIQENVALPSSSRRPYGELANDAMNQVLMRSINTSLMTLLPVGSLLFVGSFLLGADTLRELALALFVGIAAGTYSSIFVATPLLSIFKEREPRYALLKAGRKVPASVDVKDSAGPSVPTDRKRPPAKAKPVPAPPARGAVSPAGGADVEPEGEVADDVIEGISIGAAGAGTPKQAPKPAAKPGGQQRQQPRAKGRPNNARKKKGRR